jgi:allantoicase
MNQYNYYKGVYEAQVEQEATAWERDYKERQLQLQQDKALWDQIVDKSKLEREKEKYQSDMDYKKDQMNYNYYQLNSKNPISESTMQ